MANDIQDQRESTANAITAADLALLIRRDLSHVSRHMPVLPRASVLLPTPGRHARAWPAEALLDWADARTAHLSDEQCRLIAAFQERS